MNILVCFAAAVKRLPQTALVLVYCGWVGLSRKQFLVNSVKIWFIEVTFSTALYKFRSAWFNSTNIDSILGWKSKHLDTDFVLEVIQYFCVSKFVSFKKSCFLLNTGVALKNVFLFAVVATILRKLQFVRSPSFQIYRYRHHIQIT